MSLPQKFSILTDRFGSTPSRWVTRERPKIDRIACPWLVLRFVDPGAEFYFVQPDLVLQAASEHDAIPFDIPNVEFSHKGDECSFDAFISKFQLRDEGLDRLALIIRGADTSQLDLAPQCAGLYAISLGLSANFADDHEMLRHGLIMYDALYSWCASLQQETHNWPPVGGSASR